jgi:hypothetical protein
MAKPSIAEEKQQDGRTDDTRVRERLIFSRFRPAASA